MRAKCRVVPRCERLTLWRNALPCVSQSNRQEGKDPVGSLSVLLSLVQTHSHQEKVQGAMLFIAVGYDLTPRLVPSS